MKFQDFNPLMEKYMLKANNSSLLPSNEIFYLMDRDQSMELKGLYFFLFNAKDFETLRQNICWARLHVQSQMFIFALTQTLVKREDFKDLNLPKIYEIWPQHFFADKYIRNLRHFNYVQWSKWDMHKKDFNATYKSLNRTCKIGQWWCQENLQFQIYKEKERMILPKNIYGDFRNSSKWLKALEDVSLYWLPVDFSREAAGVGELTERSISYLIEDKSWNAYWYYINMGLWMNEKGQNDLYSKTLRDWWFWNLQQIVIRYKMEETAPDSKTYMEPYLINYQGLKYQTTAKKSSNGIQSFLSNLSAITQKALNEQNYELQNNTRLQLTNPENFEFFLNENFGVEKVLKAFMSSTTKSKNPFLLQYFETMLRSKEFYHYAEMLVNLYKSLKTNFESYKPQDFQSVGVTINDVEITKLKTYFEIVDTDVTNLLRSSNVYFEGKLLWFKSLLARQQSLQHQPFKFLFNLTSDKPQAVLVRTFLARDCSAATTKKSSAASEFYQIDTFVSSLAVGYNIIERESKDFYGYMLPSLTYTELYQFTHLALNEDYQFPFNITLGNCRFPHHLKLPKGLEGNGLPVKFVFVITAYNYRFHKAFNLDCDFSSGVLAFDDLPPGFPFDREMSESIFLGDNVLVKNRKIYHDNKMQFRQK